MKFTCINTSDINIINSLDSKFFAKEKRKDKKVNRKKALRCKDQLFK